MSLKEGRDPYQIIFNGLIRPSAICVYCSNAAF